MYIYNETKLPYSVKKDGDVGIIFRRSSKGKTFKHGRRISCSNRNRCIRRSRY